MPMQKTLAIVERLHTDGIIGLNAIGGAVGVTSYLEPMAAVEVDVFVLFEPVTPIYEACAKLGYEAEGEGIQIGGWPVRPSAFRERVAVDTAVAGMRRSACGASAVQRS